MHAPQQHRARAPASAAAPPSADPVVGTAVALIEAAALTAAMRGVASWSPLAYVYAAADRAWAAPGGAEIGETWRTGAGARGAGFRAAVLLAEASVTRFVADGGYLSERQLSVDLRHAADWLAAGAPFDA